MGESHNTTFQEKPLGGRIGNDSDAGLASTANLEVIREKSELVSGRGGLQRLRRLALDMWS